MDYKQTYSVRCQGSRKANVFEKVKKIIINTSFILFCLTLSAFSKTGEDINTIIQKLNKEDLSVRYEAAQQLAKVKEINAVETLIKLLKHEDWFIREAAAKALGEIKDVRAVEPLINLLKDDNGHVQQAAAAALDKIPDTRVKAALNNWKPKAKRILKEDLEGKAPNAQIEIPKQQETTAKLELKGWRWYREYSHVIAEGLVKNISPNSLRSVEAVVTCYDSQDKFITSDSALVEYNPILPGQESPFKVIGTYNPEMSKSSIDFKEAAGTSIRWEKTNE